MGTFALDRFFYFLLAYHKRRDLWNNSPWNWLSCMYLRLYHKNKYMKNHKRKLSNEWMNENPTVLKSQQSSHKVKFFSKWWISSLNVNNVILAGANKQFQLAWTQSTSNIKRSKDKDALNNDEYNNSCEGWVARKVKFAREPHPYRHIVLSASMGS